MLLSAIRSRLDVTWWMAASVIVSLVLSMAALAAFGYHERGLDAALMLTARWGFLLFWPAYAGSGLAALLGGRLDFFSRHGRKFGLAFAAAMVVHVGLIGWLCAVGAAPVTGVFLFFGPALVCIYTLALFSLPRFRRGLGRRSWWWLRTVAMNYIAYAFASDFMSRPFGGGIKHIALYAPFALLSALGFAAYATAQLLSTRKARAATS